MHEVVYSPTTHGVHARGEIFMHGNIFDFMREKFIFMHEDIRFSRMKLKLLCMKCSCHDFSMHETFVRV